MQAKILHQYYRKKTCVDDIKSELVREKTLLCRNDLCKVSYRIPVSKNMDRMLTLPFSNSVSTLLLKEL